MHVCWWYVGRDVRCACVVVCWCVHVCWCEGGCGVRCACMLVCVCVCNALLGSSGNSTSVNVKKLEPRVLASLSLGASWGPVPAIWLRLPHKPRPGLCPKALPFPLLLSGMLPFKCKRCTFPKCYCCSDTLLLHCGKYSLKNDSPSLISPA